MRCHQAVFGIVGRFSKFYLLSDFGQIWCMGQFWGDDFEFEQKNKIQIQFEREKCHLFRKSENFDQDLFKKVLPWQGL